MKTTLLKLKYFIIAGIAILAFSCNGEDGMDGLDGLDGSPGIQGEQGPVGQDGTNGTNGTDGQDGEDGQDGNANVEASPWLEPTEESYSVNNPRFKALVLATGMSPTDISEGTIIVYYDNDLEVVSLPKYQLDIDGNIDKSIDAHINHASRTLYVNIERFGSDLTAGEYLWNPTGPAYGKGVRFRYVLIPPTSTGKGNQPNFFKMTYEEVMDYFGLEK